MAWSRELYKRVNYGCDGNYKLVFEALTLVRSFNSGQVNYSIFKNNTKRNILQKVNFLNNKL